MPPHRVKQSEAAQWMIDVLKPSHADKRKIKAVYHSSSIDSRYSVLSDYLDPKDRSFFPNQTGLEPFPGTRDRMELYQKFAPGLAQQAIEKVVSETERASITHFIAISCTGMYAPGWEIEVIQNMGFRTQVQRTAIQFMGCYAAFNGLKVADAIVRSNPDARVLMVCLELCTIHFQKDLSIDNLLANSLFADGAAAALITALPGEERALKVTDFFADLALQGKEEMAWFIRDTGFEMRLTSLVPKLLAGEVQPLIQRLLNALNFQDSAPDLYALHPGGKKILEALELSLDIAREKNSAAYEVLRNFGNMSSATILFVLKSILESEQLPASSSILSMALGPGLTIESARMELTDPVS